MPIVRFVCEGCGETFWDIVPAGTKAPCPRCGLSDFVRREPPRRVVVRYTGGGVHGRRRRASH